MTVQEIRKKVFGSRKDLAEVHCAVVVFRDGDRFLLSYNENWRAMMFPVTKCRSFWHESLAPTPVFEEPVVAAARAALEIIHRTVSPKDLGQPLVNLEEVDQSLGDGQWKCYYYTVYMMDWRGSDALPQDRIVEWLTKDDIKKRLPVSPTALAIAAKLP